MKKIITTVGTSLFNNIDKQIYIENKDYLEKAYSEIDERRNSKISKRIKSEIGKISDKNIQDISAEIKSIIKYYIETKECLEIILVTTDTIISNLVAEIVTYIFKRFENINVLSVERIKGLQVLNRNLFLREGFPNLINKLNIFILPYPENTIINITGGFKAFIPLITIYASINQVKIIYIYEHSKELLFIPKLPIKIDDVYIKNNYKYLNQISFGTDDYFTLKNSNYEIFDDLEKRGFLEIDSNFAFLSPMGLLFLDKFKKINFTFYCPDDVWNEISHQPDIKRILQTKFYDNNLRTNKLEKKQNHYVFDDGNNNNRIYFFIENNNIYIYKTFQSEEKAKEYISTTINRDDIIVKSKQRTIQLEDNNE